MARSSLTFHQEGGTSLSGPRMHLALSFSSLPARGGVPVEGPACPPLGDWPPALRPLPFQADSADGPLRPPAPFVLALLISALNLRPPLTEHRQGHFTASD